jgi:dihydropteroate synthase
MHMQGNPQTMQLAPHYDDVVEEVAAFLTSRLHALKAAGVNASRVLLDPGFGFGKRREDNIQLLKHLQRLTDIGPPLLVGLSRKSILGAIAGNDASQKMHAGIAASVISVLKGARVLRVHDVKATADAFAVVNALQDQEV